jgi:hypothetical protein
MPALVCVLLVASGCARTGTATDAPSGASRIAGERIAKALGVVTASASLRCRSTTCWMRAMGDLVRAAKAALTTTAEAGAMVPAPCRSLVPEMNEWLVTIRDAAAKARHLRSPPVGEALPTNVVRDDLAPLADAFRQCAAPG